MTARAPRRKRLRDTNQLSESIVYHAHLVTVYFMSYSFCTLHKAHRLAPAMAAGITDRLWEVADIVKVLEDWEHRQ